MLYFLLLNLMIFRTTAVLTSGHLSKLGQIIDSVYKSGLKISQMRTLRLSPQEAYSVLESQRDKPSFK
jgi:hypothetical protein